MMCATRIDQKPRLPARPAVVNSASRDEPITTSGVAIGRKISTLVAGRARNPCRAAPAAERGPRHPNRDQGAEKGRDPRGEKADLEAGHHRAAHAALLARVEPV